MTWPPGKVPRILLTNDDGFDAPGLAALIDVADKLADEIWVIAPQLDQSGMGQSITMNGPLRCVPRGERRFAVSGTPADCVIMGLSHLMLEAPPALILSGVNAGSNTGDDINLSGTLGAAFTGIMLGVPSIGISLDCLSRKNLRWDTARAVLPGIIADLMHEGWDIEQALSVNIPDLPPEKITGLRRTRPARKTLTSFRIDRREDLRERDYYWLYPLSNDNGQDADSDLAALARGEVSVTALTLDRSLPANV